MSTAPSPLLGSGKKFDSFEEAISGILSPAGGDRQVFRPVQRQAASPALPHSTSGRFSDDGTPTSRVKSQVAAISRSGTPVAGAHASTPTPSGPAVIKAKVTPAASIRNKLLGAAPSSTRSQQVEPRTVPANARYTPTPTPAASDFNSYVSSGRTAGNAAGKDNVLVCLRMRPAVEVGHSAMSAAEKRAADGHAVDEAYVADPQYARVTATDGGHEYNFDAVVTGSDNAELYDRAARHLVAGAIDGFDTCIFAYGQTASGKTFSLSGSPSTPGILQRGVKQIFETIAARPEREYLLRVSQLEIYNENLKDLLASPAAGEGQLKIRQDQDKRFYVSALHEEIVTSEAQVAALLRRADKARHTAGTDFNARSSRSHVLFQMVIESRDAVAAGGRDTGRTPSRAAGARLNGPLLDDAAGPVTMSRLSIIDLAGSESATSQADRRVEGAFINKSLLTLEKVIFALTDPKARGQHIPFRDSKLTQILQPSLSGEARVAVVICVNPATASVKESKSTLAFATRIKKVALHAEKRELVDDKALITRYRAQIEHLQRELAMRPADTPRSAVDDDARARRDAADAERAKRLHAEIDDLRSLFTTAHTIDKAGPSARPVQAPQPRVTESPVALHEQLLDHQDRLAESEELISRLKRDLSAAQKLSLQPFEVPAEPEGKDQIIAQLRRDRNELEICLTQSDRDYALVAKRAERAAEREVAGKVAALEGELEAQKALSADLRDQLERERKRGRQLEFYCLNVLQKQADTLGRGRRSSLDSSLRGLQRSVSGESVMTLSALGLGASDDDGLPRIADELPDFLAADISRMDLACSAGLPRPSLLSPTEPPRRRLP